MRLGWQAFASTQKALPLGAGRKATRNNLRFGALWNKGEEVREQIRVVILRREEVQARLKDLLRPFRTARVVPAVRATGGTVKQLITEVRRVLPGDSPPTPHLEEALDQALAVEDEGTALGRMLDLFLFWEVRGARVQGRRTGVARAVQQGGDTEYR